MKVPFVMWGFTDRHSWVPWFFEGYGSALIFDDSYCPKPAYHAVRMLLLNDLVEDEELSRP